MATNTEQKHWTPPPHTLTEIWRPVRIPPPSMDPGSVATVPIHTYFYIHNTITIHWNVWKIDIIISSNKNGPNNNKNVQISESFYSKRKKLSDVRRDWFLHAINLASNHKLVYRQCNCDFSIRLFRICGERNQRKKLDPERRTFFFLTGINRSEGKRCF